MGFRKAMSVIRKEEYTLTDERWAELQKMLYKENVVNEPSNLNSVNVDKLVEAVKEGNITATCYFLYLFAQKKEYANTLLSNAYFQDIWDSWFENSVLAIDKMHIVVLMNSIISYEQNGMTIAQWKQIAEAIDPRIMSQLKYKVDTAIWRECALNDDLFILSLIRVFGESYASGVHLLSWLTSTKFTDAWRKYVETLDLEEEKEESKDEVDSIEDQDPGAVMRFLSDFTADDIDEATRLTICAVMDEFDVPYGEEYELITLSDAIVGTVKGDLSVVLYLNSMLHKDLESAQYAFRLAAVIRMFEMFGTGK